jgi:hypothetical protein
LNEFDGTPYCLLLAIRPLLSLQSHVLFVSLSPSDPLLNGYLVFVWFQATQGQQRKERAFEDETQQVEALTEIR